MTQPDLPPEVRELINMCSAAGLEATPIMVDLNKNNPDPNAHFQLVLGLGRDWLGAMMYAATMAEAGSGVPPQRSIHAGSGVDRGHDQRVD
jgi:hypothetical protein